MSAADLARYGFQPIATFYIADRNLRIEVTDQETIKLEKCTYAFVIDDVIVRIGSIWG